MAEEEKSLMQNKFLWQLLSAGGQDILAGGPIGANAHQATTQNIRGQNYAKLLKDMLGKGGKLTMDGQNISFKAPVAAFQGPEGEGSQTALAAPQEAIGLGGGATPGPGVPTTVNQMKPTEQSAGYSINDVANLLGLGGLSKLNPSASPLDLSPSDLAGLMPEDISNALKFKMAQDESTQAAAEKAMTRALKMRELDLEQRKLMQAKDTPTIREYEYAVKQGYKGSLEDYRKIANDPEKLDMYRQAKSEGYSGSFMEWLGEYSSLTKPVTNIYAGDKVAEQEAMKKMQNRMWFTSPTGMAEDMQKFISTPAVRQKLLPYLGDPEAHADAAGDAIATEIQSRIINAGGKVDSVEPEGNTMVWKITWDDGRKSEVRYVLK